jgi:molybdate transport system ATP-binding protein
MSLEIDVEVERGGLHLKVELRCSGTIAIMGPNGAGKTTLLRAVAGALRPRSGRIAIANRVVFDSVRGIDLPPEQRRIAYVPQGFGLFPHLSVRENVGFGSKDPTPWLERLGITALAARKPPALSSGEQQRVALARALASEPSGLLFDEPLSALDPLARSELRELLAEWLKDTGLPALVVGHDSNDAQALAGELIVLEKGRIVQRGAFEEIARAPATPFAAALAKK